MCGAYRYFNCCTAWDPADVHVAEGLISMTASAIKITRRTFLKYVDVVELNEIATSLGYAVHPKQGLTMAGDWGVSYCRSVLHGKRVYYFLWSRIEYVFMQREEVMNGVDRCN